MWGAKTWGQWEQRAAEAWSHCPQAVCVLLEGLDKMGTSGRNAVTGSHLINKERNEVLWKPWCEDK